MNSSFEDNLNRFLDIIEEFRPKLHKYCSRMSGSSLDGEDLVQETLAQAYYKISQLKQDRPLEPWLFRIAHNKCIDFLRKNHISIDHLEEIDEISGSEEVDIEMQQEVEQALKLLINHFPPMERACMLLKDVLDYTLIEIATIIECTQGAVKSALHRGRARLATIKTNNKKELKPSPHRDLLTQYVTLFNQQNWHELDNLIRDDVQLTVVGVSEQTGREVVKATYFNNYSKLSIPWKTTLGYVDGEEVLICWRDFGEGWQPNTALRLEVINNQVISIRDYIHVEYLLEDADIDSPSRN